MKSDTMKVVSTSSRRVESPPSYFEDFKEQDISAAFEARLSASGSALSL